MHVFESVAVALESIWANKLRSLLTVLGNIVAVTASITVVALIQGLNTYVTDAIVTNVGADSFTVERTGITRTDEELDKARGNPLITLRDASAIRRYSPIVSAVVAQASRNTEVSYGQHLLESVRVQGVTRDLAQFSVFDAERGRLPSPLEVERSQPVVLLGWETADRLFEDTDPLDKIVKISRVHFRVVGVSKKKGSSFGQSLDEFAVIPLGAYQKLFGARQSLALMVKPRDPSSIDPAIEQASIALRIERRLRPAHENNFGVFTSDTILGIYHQATTGIYTVLVGVVALSLVVGGIVIMNIMLMVVTERTREIGLRKALGARRRDIVWQVLTESVTLSTCGGVVGTALGFLAALAISRLTPVPAAIQPWAVAVAVSITAGVGLFFGLYPAIRAASLDPIEALRHE
jgi:putative ABC transport system permease protein